MFKARRRRRPFANLLWIFLIFFAILGAVSVLIKFGQVEFGKLDFWQRHGLFFLAAITFFPRLTLLFSSIPFGGILWWISFVFCPRILVGVLATVTYWHTNPLLVLVAWLVALSGETTEKYVVHQRGDQIIRGRDIEAEYTVKK